MISPCMESNPKFFHTLCGKSTVMRSFGFMITRSARIVIFLHFVPTVSFFELKQMITVQAVGQILTKKWQPYSVNLFLVCMSIKKHHLVCFSPILIYCNFHGGWHFYNSFVQQENCHFYIYFILTCTLSISSFRTKICIGLSLQKLCETPGISICLCAWERVYLGRKHYREPLTNKRWETKGRTERRKSITGEKKTSILCAFRGSEWEREKDRAIGERQGAPLSERRRLENQEGKSKWDYLKEVEGNERSIQRNRQREEWKAFYKLSRRKKEIQPRQCREFCSNIFNFAFSLNIKTSSLH